MSSITTNFNYEVLNIEILVTADHKKFRKIAVRQFKGVFLNKKLIKKVYYAHKGNLSSTIFIWDELNKNFPELQKGDIIEGELLKFGEDAKAED